MRTLLVLVFGALLGAGAMLAYVIFAGPPVAGPDEPLPKHPPITLALGAPFLEQAIQRAVDAAPGLGMSGKDVKVSLRDRELVVSAPVQVVGKTARGSISMRAILDKGQLKFDVTSTGIGGMPLPKIGQTIEQQVDARIRALMKGLPIVVTGAKVDKKLGLVITGDVDLGRLEAAIGR